MPSLLTNTSVPTFELRRSEKVATEVVHEPDQEIEIDRHGELTSGNRVISFVIPLKNESATLRELRDRIVAHTPVGFTAEIIFIDDGSSDKSWEVIRELTDTHESSVRGIRFRHNLGKAAALTAGFRAATGNIVFTMDADLQDDPVEIPAMLAKLDEGYDIVSGWKKVRYDPWHKVLPSRVFNWMVSRVCGVRLHDHNCGFKCYRAEVTRQLTLHGELHRMIPSLASILGFRTTELPVRHHARLHGVSKYGFERYLRGFSDMMTVGFLRRFRERPSHLMGPVALAHAAIGMALAAVGLCGGMNDLASQTFIISGIIFAAAAFPLFACGLVSELVIRGGLGASWKLPVVEDTAFPETAAQRDHEQDTPRRIPSSYMRTN